MRRKRLGFYPGSGSSPGGGHGNPLQCSCLENPHGQRSLAGCSPCSRKESDTTERLGLSTQFLRLEIPGQGVGKVLPGALRGLRPALSGVLDSLSASLQSLSPSPCGHLPASLLWVCVSFLSVSRTFWIQGPP